MTTLIPSNRKRFAMPTLPVHQFSVDEYHQLIKMGFLTEDHDVEFLEGWIVPKMPRNPPHDFSLSKASRLIGALLTNSPWYIRGQMAITTPDSEPEPDIAIVQEPEERFETRHPHAADIGMLIEVSDTSLRRDQDEKLVVYARAAISCYWIINLPDRQIEVYTLPTGPAELPGYGQRQIFRPGESIPVSFAGRDFGTMAVNDVLPRMPE